MLQAWSWVGVRGQGAAWAVVCPSPSSFIHGPQRSVAGQRSFSASASPEALLWLPASFPSLARLSLPCALTLWLLLHLVRLPPLPSSLLCSQPACASPVKLSASHPPNSSSFFVSQSPPNLPAPFDFPFDLSVSPPGLPSSAPCPMCPCALPSALPISPSSLKLHPPSSCLRQQPRTCLSCLFLSSRWPAASSVPVGLPWELLSCLESCHRSNRGL